MSDVMIHPTANVPIDSITVDGENPNRMTDDQKKSLAVSMMTYGWMVPIVTNSDNLVADGEQRLTVAREFSGKKFMHRDVEYDFPVVKTVPIVKVGVKDVDRRIIRQVLNKLKGQHNVLEDAREIEMIRRAGSIGNLQSLIALEDSEIAYYSEIAAPQMDLPIDDEFTGDSPRYRWGARKADQRVVAFGAYAAFVDNDVINMAIETLTNYEAKMGLEKGDVMRHITTMIGRGEWIDG